MSWPILNRGLRRTYITAKKTQIILVIASLLKSKGASEERFFSTFPDSIYQSGLGNPTQKPLKSK